eukprot:12611324-Alexandrium_andersonii.AAC.1
MFCLAAGSTDAYRCRYVHSCHFRFSHAAKQPGPARQGTMAGALAAAQRGTIDSWKASRSLYNSSTHL